MYRVLIADDEEPILQGLQVIVPWRQLGFEICGTATDGELALELIAQQKPDLVLMDIRMPGVDGMEAIETARRQGYQGYFIILSGASDFGYAQRAMRSRTSFYLTKPIDEDELADAVRSIAKELDKEGSARRELTRHARSSLLFRLLNGVYDPSVDPLSDYWLSADGYQVLACERFTPSVESISGSLAALLTGSGIDAAESDCIVIDNREFYLLRGKQQILRFGRWLTGQRTSSVLPPVWQERFLCLGRVVSTPQEVVVSYCDAVKLMQRRFFCAPLRHVLDANDLPASDTFMPLRPEDNAAYCKQFVNCIQAKNTKQMAADFAQLRETLCQRCENPTVCKMFLTEVYVTVRQQIVYLYKNSMLSLANETGSVRFIEEKSNLYDILDFMHQQFTVFSTTVHSGADSTIDRVQHYIELNCAQPLKLEEIAPLFGYNSSYLGKLFREQTNCSFNEYLDKVRMEHAKELLQKSSLRVYEVAAQLGYKDVDYFHKKFKKYVGVSPNEFRKVSENGTPKW